MRSCFLDCPWAARFSRDSKEPKKRLRTRLFLSLLSCARTLGFAHRGIATCLAKNARGARVFCGACFSFCFCQIKIHESPSASGKEEQQTCHVKNDSINPLNPHCRETSCWSPAAPTSILHAFKRCGPPSGLWQAGYTWLLLTMGQDRLSSSKMG